MNWAGGALMDHLTPTPADRERMREISMGDEAFLRELIDLFLEDTPRQIEALRQAVASQNIVGVHQGAHRLKGAGRNLGAQPFSEVCRQIETLGRKGDLAAASALMPNLESEFSRLQDFLNHLPAKEPSQGAGP